MGLSEWDDTPWAGHAVAPSNGLPERAFPSLSVQDWVNMFRYGANTYFGAGYTQTLEGTTEELPTTFAGYIEAIKKSSAVVFACMDVRRRLFSEARFTFRRLDDGRPGELFGGTDGRNPAYRGLQLLANPWPGATHRDLLARAVDFADAGGDAFVTRRRSQLAFMRPDWVTIVGGSPSSDAEFGDLDVEVIGYIYHPGGRHSGRKPVTLLPETVAHWAPIPDTLSGFHGMSWLTPVLREIAGDSAMTNHKLQYFEHAATPNLAVSLDASVTLKDAKEWIELFRQDHEGMLNAYRTLFLGGGSKPVPVGNDLQQIDFKAVQGAGETRIAAAAGVPPIIVGLSEGLASATYSNYGQARRAFADLTMRPLWGGFCAALASIIDVPDDAQLWYDDRDISFLQEDVKDAAEILKSQASAIQTIFNTGWEPDTVIDAVTSGDLRRLIGSHSGLTSVQLQAIGAQPEPITVSEPERPQIPAQTGRSEAWSEVKCPSCGKYLGEVQGAYRSTCPRCKSPVAA